MIRKICDISNRIYDLLQPIENEGLTLEEQVKNNLGLSFKLIRFESKKRVEKSDVKGIYQGRVLLDRKLYDGKNPDRFANYIENLKE